MQYADREMLLERIANTCVVEGTFLVSHGVMEDNYLDLYQAILCPTASPVLVDELYLRVKGVGADGVGGMEVAGAVLGAQLAASFNGLHSFVARKQPKPYGLRYQVDGYHDKGSKVAIVEDVLVSGNTTQKVIDLLEADGCEIVGIFPIVDRIGGGSDKFRAAGYHVDPLFTLQELFDVRKWESAQI